MEWFRALGMIFEEYIRQVANQETEFLWLIESGAEALIRLLCTML